MVTQEIKLNMIPDSEPVVVHVNQYDEGTGRLVIKLYKDNAAYAPEVASVIIQGTKPDKKGFAYNATISGNTVTADLTQQMTACAGDVRTQVIVTESSGKTGTFVFILKVQASALQLGTDMSETEIPAYLDGVTSYIPLSDKPRINNIELIGNKTGSQLGLQNTLVIGSDGFIEL